MNHRLNPPKKILYINHYAGSPSHGMEYRPYYLAREWVKSGHTVQILAASHSHIRTQQPSMPNQPITNEFIDGIHYRWYHTPPYQNNGLARVKNMLGFLRALRKDALNIAETFKPDVVIASSTYPMDIRPAKRIANLAGAKLIFEVHDLWPLSPIELGGMSRWHPFIQWVQWAEDYAYRQADYVVSLLPKAKDYMVSRGMDPDKFRYIPNGIDPDAFAHPAPLPEAIESAIQRVKAKGLPLVGYAGTHGLANALDNLLDAAKLGIGQFEVVMVGPGPERERLLKRVAEEKLSNVTMLPAIPKNAMPSFLDKIDVAYIGLQDEPLFRFGISPNKLMDYMMCAKPIVMAISAGNDPVKESDCGVSALPNNPQSSYDAILHIIGLSASSRTQMGERGKHFILENQTYPILANIFIQELEPVMALALLCYQIR